VRENIELYIPSVHSILKTGIEGEQLVRPVYAYSRLGVFPNSFLEEVSFAL
jgi:hypothetical protein